MPLPHVSQPAALISKFLCGCQSVSLTAPTSSSHWPELLDVQHFVQCLQLRPANCGPGWRIVPSCSWCAASWSSRITEQCRFALQDFSPKCLNFLSVFIWMCRFWEYKYESDSYLWIRSSLLSEASKRDERMAVLMFGVQVLPTDVISQAAEMLHLQDFTRNFAQSLPLWERDSTHRFKLMRMSQNPLKRITVRYDHQSLFMIKGGFWIYENYWVKIHSLL